jgi:lipopolysaccharide export system permease protein
MASQGRVDAIVGLWVPFLLLGVMIVWMYHVLAHKPGGQPIGALEFAASKSWRFIRGVLPRRGRPNPA